MGGNRGSTKKSKSKGGSSWRDIPGTSRDPPRAPWEDQETEGLLPTEEPIETISSLVSGIESTERGNSTEGAGPSNPRRKGGIGRGVLERTRLCLCAVFQCTGPTRSCEICKPRRITYERMENEEHKEENSDRDLEKYNSLLLNFYIDNPNAPEFSPLLVTPSMSTVDVIRGVSLSQKNENTHFYTIVEHWKDFEAERILEDHEVIQDVRREQVRFFNSKFVFLYRGEFDKYEYIDRMEEYFIKPKDVRLVDYKKKNEEPSFIQVQDPFYTEKPDILTGNEVESSEPEEIPEEDLVNPIFCGSVHIKHGNKDMTIAEIEKLPEKKEKAHWIKKHLLLRNRNLYFVDNRQNMLKYYHIDDNKFNEVLDSQKKSKKSTKPLEFIGAVADFQVYKGLNTKRYHSAPFGGGIYLKQHDGTSKKPIKLMFCCKNNKKVTDPNNFTRKLWMAAFRLAKHGTQIKENYIHYKLSVREYTIKMRLLREANDPRVAMDFALGRGRVVQDPKEAAVIARGESRSGNGQKSTRFQPLMPASPDILNFGPHLTQSYYHKDLSREQADEILIQTKIDGAFILRDSKNRPGWLVITYMHALRVLHHCVMPVVLHDIVKDENILVVSLDKDTVFYDVHSLIEYHRLNKGSLQCTLTISIKNPQQPDGTPPRRRKPNSKTSSPQAGPSREHQTLNISLKEGSALPQPQNDNDEEEEIFSTLQIGLKVNTSIRENNSPKPTTLKTTPAQIDLLTSEIHPDPNASLRPVSSRPSSSPRPGGASSSISSRDGDSSKSSPQVSPRV